MKAIFRPIFLTASLFLITICLLSSHAIGKETPKPVSNAEHAPTLFRMKGDTIDFSGDTIREPVDSDFWIHQLEAGLKGVNVDSNPRSSPKIVFRKPINFQSTKMIGGIFCHNAHFFSPANFESAIFDSKADFSSAHFESKVNFMKAHFASRTGFMDAIFDSIAQFGSVAFDSAPNFDFVSFHSLADFNNTHFSSAAYFDFALFGAGGNFYKACFETTVQFDQAMLFGTLNFRQAQFKTSLDFWLATLPEFLDFTNVTDLTHQVDLTMCFPHEGTEKCQISVTGTDVSRFKLDMSIIAICFPTNWIPRPGRGHSQINIGVSSSEISKLNKGNETLTYPSYDQKTSIYQQVLKKLKDDCLMDSYQILDIEYRKFKAKHDGGLTYYVGNTFQNLWWNYGYSSQRIFLWTLCFWTLFSVINFWAYGKLMVRVYTIPFLDRWDHRGIFRNKKWPIYILQVITYTAIVFFGLKMDIEKFRPEVVRSHSGLFAYLMTIYVVGLVCLGYIVNIIFTK